VCTPDIAMSGGDGMDSALEYRVSAPGHRERREEETGGEILSTHGNRRVEMWWHSFLGLVLFRLVPPSSAWSGRTVP
jgi:hypothetical protein